MHQCRGNEAGAVVSGTWEVVKFRAPARVLSLPPSLPVYEPGQVVRDVMVSPAAKVKLSFRMPESKQPIKGPLARVVLTQPKRLERPSVRKICGSQATSESGDSAQGQPERQQHRHDLLA